ncbi:hypothetical protein lerEdw1_004155 [Lerista edwardsae]|nr:hypothetical protein lerEdw1_004155 [Lerista edwardsae]
MLRTRLHTSRQPTFSFVGIFGIPQAVMNDALLKSESVPTILAAKIITHKDLRVILARTTLISMATNIPASQVALCTPGRRKRLKKADNGFHLGTFRILLQGWLEQDPMTEHLVGTDKISTLRRCGECAFRFKQEWRTPSQGRLPFSCHQQIVISRISHSVLAGDILYKDINKQEEGDVSQHPKLDGQTSGLPAGVIKRLS